MPHSSLLLALSGRLLGMGTNVGSHQQMNMRGGLAPHNLIFVIRRDSGFWVYVGTGALTCPAERSSA